MIKCWNFPNKQETDLHGLYDLPSSIDKVSFKKNSMSLGFIVLEEKLFWGTCYASTDTAE